MVKKAQKKTVVKKVAKQAVAKKENKIVEIAERKKTTAKPVKKVDDFRKLYDDDYKIPKDIEKAIKTLGKESWMYELDFVRENGMSVNKVALYREMFEDYIVYIRKDNKRVWCGSVELADQLRKIVR